MFYSGVVQPIRHSSHVANGHLNNANGFASNHLKNSMFRAKQQENLYLNNTLKNQNGGKQMAQDSKFVYKLDIFVPHFMLL